MSAKLMGEVFNLKLSQSEKLVLLAMADFANDDGTRVFPSVARIAWKVDLSTRQVQRIISNLKLKNLLVIVREPNSRLRRATEYRIDLRAGERKMPFKKDIPTVTGDITMSSKNDTLTVTDDITMSPQTSFQKHQKEASSHTHQVSGASAINLEICKKYVEAVQTEGKLINNPSAYAYSLFKNPDAHTTIQEWMETGVTGNKKRVSAADRVRLKFQAEDALNVINEQ